MNIDKSETLIITDAIFMLTKSLYFRENHDQSLEEWRMRGDERSGENLRVNHRDSISIIYISYG